MTKEYEYKAVQAEMVMVDFDTQVAKRAGGTYEGTNIMFKAFGKVNEKGFTTKTYEFKPELRAQLETVNKKGTKFTLNYFREAGGQFWNINDVQEGHAPREATQAQAAGGGSFSNGPNPAAVGQAMNLAVELGMCKSYADMADPNKVREAIICYKAAKALFSDLWEPAVKEPQPKVRENENEGFSDSFNDDVPF